MTKHNIRLKQLTDFNIMLKHITTFWNKLTLSYTIRILDVQYKHFHYEETACSCFDRKCRIV
jgi:hypothetical protein